MAPFSLRKVLKILQDISEKRAYIQHKLGVVGGRLFPLSTHSELSLCLNEAITVTLMNATLLVTNELSCVATPREMTGAWLVTSPSHRGSVHDGRHDIRV